MKKTLKRIAIGLAIVFVLLQFIRPDRSNPPTVEADRLEASVNVPADVAAVLKRSCADCHTHETDFPWYSNISPVSWWMKDHVEHARSHLNFSKWNIYTAQQKSKKLEEICEQVESREMPLPSYLWMHRDAALSDTDAKLLCDWARGPAGDAVR